ncbi:MAG: serine/threonine-protein kinase [Oscillospiraceae bacterium]|nr:serine/threonine-protein kinase [Oscillospiraceae bacterium]
MSEVIIASTYKMLESLGSGGGGIVHKAQHLRLNKEVALKADKREITTAPELLRREVDVLKDLSHPYIPQVYDYFEEDGTVYTVMDYVKGESLDKLLKRGERFSQVQVIQWARQLLEALDYLHKPIHGEPPRGYVHSDIKPANIMRRENGDICLIDFNISLALGEKNAIGASPGYASPEHYGLDFSFSGSLRSGFTPTMEDRTVALTAGKTLPVTKQGLITPDVRSDIYSLGATLYHLLSGTRPAKNAAEVVPLSGPEISGQVIDIITKSMNPNPDLRYQTAQEMLDAFCGLHDNDPRTIRYHRRVKVTATLLTLLFLTGVVCTFAGLKQMERIQALAAEEARIAEEAERIAKRALADTTASESAFLNGDVAEAVRLARDALSLRTAYDARAQAALTNALGVYDLSGGYRAHTLLELPGEPTQAVLSPEGTRAGAMAGGQLLVFDTDSGEQLAALPAENSALAQLVFRGEDVVIYAGDGAVCAYDLVQKKELWTGGAATAIALSADGATVAAAYKDDTAAVIYDAVTGLVRQTVDFQGYHLHAAFNNTFIDPDRDLFALNANGTMLAVGFSDSGALWVYNLEDREGDIQLYDQSDFQYFEGGFYGPYLAFTAGVGKESVFAVIDTVELVQTGGYAQPMRFHVQTDESGVYFAAGRLLVRLDPETFEENKLAYGDSYITAVAVDGAGYSVIKTESGLVTAFDADADALNVWDGQEQCSFIGTAGDFLLTASSDTPNLCICKLEGHQQEQIISYDKTYEHDEARLSGDGKTVMLFRYNQFRLMDMDGKVLADVEIPIPEGDQVYDQQFRRDADGSRLEVTYYSGLIRTYSAADGSLLSEEQKTPPDDSLFEEFVTDRLRIERPLHGTPEVFDLQSGEKLGELDPDNYLTYVTQIGECIMTEYISAQTGERYGLLLNENLEVLAELPGLCDVFEDGRLIFDDGKGGLRQSHVYSAEELLALAEKY